MGSISRRLTAILLIIVAISSLTVLVTNSANAQTATIPSLVWSKTYGPSEGNGILQTNDGGYILAGMNATFKPFTPHNPSEYVNETGLLVKIDSEGNVIWEKTYGSLNSNSLMDRKIIYSIAQTNDGGYLLCGNGDWLLKVDSNGNKVWEKTFGLHSNSNYIPFRHTYPTGDGFVLQGEVYTDNPYDTSVVIIKTDLNGNVLWNKTISEYNEQTKSFVQSGIIVLNSSRYIIISDTNNQIFLETVDSNGNYLSNRTYSDLPKFDLFSSVMVEQSGDIVLSVIYNQQSNQQYENRFVKIQNGGTVGWTDSFIASPLYGLEQDSFGNYVALSGDNLVGFGVNGNLLWNVSLMGLPKSFALTKDNGFVVIGMQYYDNLNQHSIFVQKFSLPSSNSTSSPIGALTSEPTILIITILVSLLAIAIFAILFRRHRKHTLSSK
jgi:hypothetical protein